jgi:hypothetical protein
MTTGLMVNSYHEPDDIVFRFGVTRYDEASTIVFVVDSAEASVFCEKLAKTVQQLFELG